jgi:low affinity Fe/Cu permease
MARHKEDIFTRFTSAVSRVMGRPWIFVIALGLLALWGISGPLLGFSDTWQLIINTSTTIITFLTVFIIQNTQNRDNLAINIKLDMLMKKAGITAKELLEAEDKSDKELENAVTKVQSRAAKKLSQIGRAHV